jgi:hypothetical protein
MSFLSGIFDKKPGGTFVGNLIRAAASGATGGVLGQGKNKVNEDGTVGNGDTGSVLSDIIAAGASIFSNTKQGQQVIQDSATTYTAATAKNNWVWLGIIGFMGFIIMLLTFSRK